MSSVRTRIGEYVLTPRVRSTRDSLYELLSKRWVLIAITVVPPLGMFVSLNLLPTTWTFFASLYNIPLYAQEWIFIGLENYSTILSDPAFWGSLWTSLLFTGGSVALQLVFGIGIALLLNRSSRFMSMARTIILVPYLFPAALVALLGVWMGHGTWGVLNNIAVEVGLVDDFINFYGSYDMALISVIGTFSWKYIFFVSILVLAQLNSIPRILYEAAEMSGASGWQKFRHITLPNLKGVIFIVVLLRGVWTFNNFDMVYTLTQGGPGDATTTLPIYAYDAAFQVGVLGIATAISVVMYLIIVIAAVIYFVTLNPEEEVRVE